MAYGPLPAGPLTAGPGPVAPGPCPTCGRLNDSGSRFCHRCGRQLVASTLGHQPPPPKSSAVRTWWQGWGDSSDRAARRAYRQSLPAFYRWRRVIAAVAALGAVGSLLWGTGGRPIAYAQDRYWQDRDNWLQYAEYEAAVTPADTPTTGEFGRLTDGSENAWTMFWDADTPPARCGAVGASPELVLTFDEPQAVQRIIVYPGLWDPGVRPLQFRPAALVVSTDDRCLATQAVPDKSESATITLDGGPRVTSLRIGVSQVTPPVEGGDDALSLAELRVLVRPF